MSNIVRGLKMPQQEEMEDMPIWQNHEQRITNLESTVQGFSLKMDNIESKMDEVGRSVKEEGKEQKALLNRLINHHLATNRFKLSSFWKLILNITGAGGLLIAVVYAVLQFLN